jgi:hypothetical protein
LTATQSLNTPPETNEESTSEELEEDNEELQHDLSEGNYLQNIYRTMVSSDYQVRFF